VKGGGVDRGLAVVLSVAGVFALAVGVWVGFVGTFSVGLGLTGIGACCLAAGIILATERDEEEWRDELDRWEARWGAEWVPHCPVHGSALCYTRSWQCPSRRTRMSDSR
jgi:hypothetical protein